jgi:disulfide bond formation protein DsbB
MKQKKSLNLNGHEPVEFTHPIRLLPRVRIRFSLLFAFGGFVIFLIGAKPGLFGLDRSPVVGFIQIAVMLIGLAIICIGGYVAIHSLWRKEPPSIAADIGLRFVSTGYVVTVFSGMADVFGIGSHPLPGVPVFGVWQARGMEIGLAIIAIGFVMMFPFKKSDKQ